MNSFAIKKFFAGLGGRVILTVAMYFFVFGAMFGIMMIFDAPIVAVIFAIIFTYFGWKALSRITPNVFLIMSIGKWIAYYLIKGFISFFLGVFIAPFIIGKWLSKCISEKCAHDIEQEASKSATHVN